MTQEEFFKRYKYSIRTDKIGGGAFGTVYKAFDEILNREVAIKVSEVKIMGGKEFSLKDEFDAIKDVPAHPNIANYEELVTLEMPNGIFDYAIMQFYKDGNLSSFINSNPTLEQKEQVAIDLLNGINHLHKHSIVHRDLKPGNILIVKRGDKIIPVITDFGLSKNAKLEGQSRFSNSFGGGTLKYSSPEQLKAEKLRLNTDLWAYGVIVHEIFTGKNLFMAHNITGASAEAEKEIYEQIIGVDFSEMLKELPAKWKRVVEECLVRDGAKRIQSAEALKEIILNEATPLEELIDDKTIISEEEPEELIDDQTVIDEGQTVKKETSSKENIQNKTPKKEQPKEVFVEKKEPKKKKKPLLVAVIIIGLVIISGLAYTMLPSESNDWEMAKKQNTLDSYQVYLEKYPEGEFKGTAIENLEWIQLDKESSVNLKMFIAKNPESEQNQFAQELITRIEYDSIVSIGSTPSYNYFISKYPNSALSDSLTVALNNIEKIEWDKVVKRNTIKEYKNFNKEYPNSEYTTVLNEKMNALSWSKKIGDTKGGYKVNKVIKYSDDKFILVGYYDKNKDYKYNGYVAMIDASGNKLWSYIFDGYPDNDFEDIALLSDGNLLVVGNANEDGKSILIYQKIAPNGNVIFKEKRAFDDGEEFNSVYGFSVKSIPGGFIIGGKAKAEDYAELLIAKYDNSGKNIFMEIYGNQHDYYTISSVVIDNKDNIYATGYFRDHNLIKIRNLVVKYNSKGKFQWEKTFEATGSRGTDSRGNFIDIDSNGNIVVAGSTNAYAYIRLKGQKHFQDANLIKLKSNGSVIFDKIYGFAKGKDEQYGFNSILNDGSDGSYILSGYSREDGKDNEFWIVKINSKGNIIWQKDYGNNNDQRIYGSVSTNDGFIFVGTDEDKLWLLKTDKNGDIL